MTDKLKILLDSGAFSARYTKGEVTLDEYIRFIEKHGQLFEGGIINLDVIGSRKESYRNWKRLQRLGFNTIPVFHLQDDTNKTEDKWLLKYLDETDYVAMGAIVKLTTDEKITSLNRIWDEYLIRYPTHKIHGLGITTLRVMQKYPWYSVDSATCTKSAMNGCILFPGRVDSDTIDYKDSFIMSISDQKEHTTGQSNSYYGGLPEGIRNFVREYCASKGFPISDSIEYRKRRPRRSRPGEIHERTYNLGLPQSSTEIHDDGEETLTNSYSLRKKWNFSFFNGLTTYLASQNKNIIIYHACNYVGVIQGMLEQNEKEDVVGRLLVSYFGLRNKGDLRRYVFSIGSKK